MPPPVSATLWTKTITLPSPENEASWSSSALLVSALVGAAVEADRVEVGRGALFRAALEEHVPAVRRDARSRVELRAAGHPAQAGAVGPHREDVAAAREDDRPAVRRERRFGVGRVFGELVEVAVLDGEEAAFDGRFRLVLSLVSSLPSLSLTGLPSASLTTSLTGLPSASLTVSLVVFVTTREKTTAPPRGGGGRGARNQRAPRPPPGPEPGRRSWWAELDRLSCWLNMMILSPCVFDCSPIVDQRRRARKRQRRPLRDAFGPVRATRCIAAMAVDAGRVLSGRGRGRARSRGRRRGGGARGRSRRGRRAWPPAPRGGAGRCAR